MTLQNSSPLEVGVAWVQPVWISATGASRVRPGAELPAGAAADHTEGLMATTIGKHSNSEDSQLLTGSSGVNLKLEALALSGVTAWRR